MQIPNGLGFYIPELKWHASKGSSFNSIVSAVEGVVRGNAALAAKYQWPTDRTGIENWVDRYNATVCQKMGWDKYIVEDTSGGDSLPKSEVSRHTLENLKSVAGDVKRMLKGARTLGEWINSGAEPVPGHLAETRAEVCVKCPKNQAGDWASWFTKPAAELIRRYAEKAASRNMTTSKDSELGLCSACNCPMKLKVHIPLSWIVDNMEKAVKADLAAGCWILRQ